MINGSKISVHRFIATTLFRMVKNDHTHQAIYIYIQWVTRHLVIQLVEHCQHQIKGRLDQHL